MKYKIVWSDIDRFLCRNLVFDNPDLVSSNRERQGRWCPASRFTIYALSVLPSFFNLSR